MIALIYFATLITLTIAAAPLLKPFAQQLVGYQFYAAIALPTELELQLRRAYAILQKSEKADMARQASDSVPTVDILSSRFEVISDGLLFDSIRENANVYCTGVQNSLRNEAMGDETCTHVYFSPFRLCCELKIVVTQHCAPRRSDVDSGERFDAALAALLTSHRVTDTRIDSDASVPRPRNPAAVEL